MDKRIESIESIISSATLISKTLEKMISEENKNKEDLVTLIMNHSILCNSVGNLIESIIEKENFRSQDKDLSDIETLKGFN